MLIEQINEFDLRGLGPVIEHVILNPDIFTIKQKSPKQIINSLFTAKNVAQGSVPCYFHLG